MERKTASETIAYLRSPMAIRERCQQLFDYVVANSPHFTVDLTQLQPVAEYVIEVMQEQYPDLQIPFHSRWRHFTVGGIPRLGMLDQQLRERSPIERAIAKFDLVILSVLLDAGAGNWFYDHPQTQQRFTRSEGLAVASLQMFCNGYFSSDPSNPLQADAQKLQTLTKSELVRGFQVSPTNPLLGLDGRLQLIQKLGHVLSAAPQIFGNQNPRPGLMVHYLLSQAENNQLPAATVFDAVMQLSDIWPGRIELNGVNLGDVWQHSAVENGLVPFHKLSQWLTYSLLEPLQELGLEITHLDTLTGLAEYRNGGLCVDKGLIHLKNSEILSQPLPVGSEIIVEWRGLTVILLDRIATTVRENLGMSSEELPLVKVLQGGTWTAGRKIATQLRIGGVPPIQIESDGTVF